MKKDFAMWRDPEQFPNGSGAWEMIRPPFSRLSSGKDKVMKAIGKWYIFDPLIITTPESATFLPPICVPELGEKIHRELLKRQEVALKVLGLSMLILIALELFMLFGPKNLGFSLKQLMPAGLVLAIWLYVSFDTFYIQKCKTNVIDRAIFSHWLHTRNNPLLKVFVGAMLVAAATQYVLQETVGGFEELIINYGVFFPAIESGGWWRYLMGPFFHSGPLHWTGNFFMGVIAATIAGALGKKSLISYFAVITVLSILVVQYLPIGTRTDGFAGVSGGIFGLYGWSIGYCYKRREMLPIYLWVTLSFFCILNIIFAAVTAAQSSQVCHVAGLVLGLFLGVAKIGWKSIDKQPM